MTKLTILRTPELQSFYPQVLYNDGSLFNLQLRGQWAHFVNTLPDPIVKIQKPNNETLSLSNGNYLKTAPLSFINAVVPGTRNISEIFISFS